MNDTTTIQEANVARLQEIDPVRVNVFPTIYDAARNCDTDSAHGKAVCVLLPYYGSPRADKLCLVCAVTCVELWLADPDQRVAIVVNK